MLITLSPLADAAPDDIERLLDSAFGTDRHSRTAYRIRANALAHANASDVFPYLFDNSGNFVARNLRDWFEAKL